MSSLAELINKTMMSSVKRKTLSVNDKLKLIDEIENGKSKAAVCRAYKLSNSTVSTIWKNRDKLRLAFEQNKSHVKKIRLCEKNDLDEALLAWLKINSSGKLGVSIPINGPVLKVMAEKLAENLGYKDFVCGSGWITRFKSRHRIVYGKPNVDECSSTDLCNVEDLADSWLKMQWPLIKPGYEQVNIFSAVETGLFYKLTPDQMPEFEEGSGGVSSTNRLTLFLCANMTGSEKRKPLVIGNKQNPRCFNNIKNLPVTYASDSKVWMTSEIFEAEIRKWDADLRAAGRKILLLVDECLAHSVSENFTNIKLQFLPANATEKLQPLSQGVTHRFKVNYRRFIVMKILDSKEEQQICRLDVLDALRLIDRAWYCVSSKTIRNSFITSGLAGSVRKLESDGEISLSDWLKLIDSKGVFQSYDMDDYVTSDDFLLTTETTLYNVVPSELQDSEESECEDEDSSSTYENRVISVREAKESLLTLTKFSETNAVSEEFTKQLNHLKTCLDYFMLENKTSL